MPSSAMPGAGKRSRPAPGKAQPDARAPKQSRPRDRREQILAAAAVLFAEYGFETTSVRQIADRVKMLPGSLYHHFNSKEEILHELLGNYLRHADATMAETTADGDAEERLIVRVVERFRDSVANWEINAILINDSAFFRRNSAFSYVQDLKTQSFRLQEKVLVDGIRTGVFRPDIDVYMMIGTIARMLSSAADWFRSQNFTSAGSETDYSFDRVVNFHVDCVLRLVRSKERMEHPVSLNLCRRIPPQPA